MISFTIFAAQQSYGSAKQHPDLEQDIMDLDDEDFLDSGGSKLTVPGESLTSTTSFMR
jgi:exosome complex component RRP4